VCFLEISVIDPPRGRPVVGGGICHNRGYGGLNPHYSVSKEFGFQKEILRTMLTFNLGFAPPLSHRRIAIITGSILNENGKDNSRASHAP
jgi:hypothetical protein